MTGNSKLVVLIVDDDERNLFALSNYLEYSANMEALISSSAPGAIEMLKGTKVDIILMDIMMPGMDGYEAIKVIKKDPATAQIPIIAVTAKAMKGDREKCLEAGADGYISKPVILAELIGKINELLKRSN